MRLETLTSPEVKALPIDKLIVLAPLGSFEQHGAHLPLTTDTDIVTAIANAVEATLSDKVLCLPCLWMGHSTHHMKFPGTLDVKQMHYIALIEDLCAFAALDGRAQDPAAERPRRQRYSGEDGAARGEVGAPDRRGMHVLYAAYWMLAAQSIKQIRESEMGGVGHACEMETSMMLHLHPGKVRADARPPRRPQARIAVPQGGHATG